MILKEITWIIKRNPEEIKQLEEMADGANVKIMGADIFRPFVLKEKKKTK